MAYVPDLTSSNPVAPSPTHDTPISTRTSVAKAQLGGPQTGHSPCPTFMTIFMVRVRHTPPSRFSSPSRLPLDVAAARAQSSQGDRKAARITQKQQHHLSPLGQNWEAGRGHGPPHTCEPFYFSPSHSNRAARQLRQPGLKRAPPPSCCSSVMTPALLSQWTLRCVFSLADVA